MATFLDIGLVDRFSSIFVFLLVFTIIYALLEYKKPFGKESKGLNALIALSIGFIIIISKAAVVMINFMTPWFIVFFLFIFLILFAVRMFGASEADTWNILRDQRVYPYIAIISVIILIAGLSSAFGQSLLETGTGEELEKEEGDAVKLPGDIEGGSTKTTSFGTNVLNTLVHPKVLGFIALLLIGVFTLTFLTRQS